ncbi:hypothetical protein LTS17_011636 [Exophiala oligosperma]
MSTAPLGPKAKRPPKRFAPLDPTLQHDRDLPKLKGIIFDVDGTLCLPQNYMFREMRSALGIPKSIDIIDHIRSLSNEPDGEHPATEPPHSPLDPTQPPSEEMLSPTSDTDPDPAPSSPQSRAVATIKAIERNAMTSQRPQPGLQELMAYLTRQGVPKALCTRNFPAPVHHLLSTFVPDEKFHPIITRETEGVQPKPSPEGLWTIASQWGLDKDVDDRVLDGITVHTGPEGEIEVDPLEVTKSVLGSGLIMVGDSIDDMASGYRAGAATVLLVNDENQHLESHEYTGLCVKRLDELIDILERGFKEMSAS